MSRSDSLKCAAFIKLSPITQVRRLSAALGTSVITTEETVYPAVVRLNGIREMTLGALCRSVYVAESPG